MTTASYPSSEKPGLVTAIAVMTLLNGIVNIFWGLTVSAALIWTLVCWPIGLLQTVLGIFEIIYAAKLLGNPPQAVQPATNLAVMEIVCILSLNVFSMIVGILALVFYNDLTVRNYFASLNGGTPPSAPAPIVPVSPAPAVPPAPRPDEGPAKPNAPRKVA